MSEESTADQSETARRIGRAAAARGDQMVSRIQFYVEQETPTGGAPALQRLIEDIAARHRRLGGTVDITAVDGVDHLISNFPGSGAKATLAPILLIGHADTVWPAGQLESMPWRIEDGNAYGPGVYDMKSGLVLMETALEILQELSLTHRPVRVVITGDEEVGSPTSQTLIAEAGRGAAAALGFEAPHADGALKTARRGSTRLRLAVSGRAAHAAVDPDAGISAIDELVDQLIELRAIIAEVRAGGGSVLCNIGTLSGGGRANVVPAAAAADIGLRFANLETERLVLERIRGLTPQRPGAEIAVEILSYRPPWPPRSSDALLVEVQKAAELFGAKLEGRPAPGAADTNLLGSLGIPTLDGFGPRGAGAHAAHEQIVLDSLTERAEVLTAVLTVL